MPAKAVEGPEKWRDYYEAVWAITEQVPQGRVTTYGAIAKALGSRGGARLVGYALKALVGQPDKQHVPAHRVLNRNGQLTGKHAFPTPTAMEDRLRADGLEVVNDHVVGFKDILWEPAEELPQA